MAMRDIGSHAPRLKVMGRPKALGNRLPDLYESLSTLLGISPRRTRTASSRRGPTARPSSSAPARPEAGVRRSASNRPPSSSRPTARLCSSSDTWPRTTSRAPWYEPGGCVAAPAPPDIEGALEPVRVRVRGAVGVATLSPCCAGPAPAIPWAHGHPTGPGAPAKTSRPLACGPRGTAPRPRRVGRAGARAGAGSRSSPQ